MTDLDYRTLVFKPGAVVVDGHEYNLDFVEVHSEYLVIEHGAVARKLKKYVVLHGGRTI